MASTAPLVQSHDIEIYSVTLTLPGQPDPNVSSMTLHKIPNASQSVIQAALQELNLLASI